MYYFAYGVISLEQNQHMLMTGSLRLIADEAWVQGKLFDTGLGFPAMAPGEGITYGKLFVVEEDAVRTLTEITNRFDELNPPYRFALHTVTAITRRGAYEAHAFMYESGDGLESLPDGVWK